MHKTLRRALRLLFQCCLLIVIFSFVSDAHAERGRSVTVKFPAFSISPGERISGVKLTTSHGRIHTGCMPNRWICDRDERSVHCYTLHPNFALAISGMLPEMIITHLPDYGGAPSLEASVELIDGSGKEYAKNIRRDELTVK